MPEVNLLAVLVAGLVAFAIGGVWYSPVLFVKPWMAAHGYSDEKMAAMKQSNPPARAMIVTAVCQIVMAYVVAVLLAWTGMAGWTRGVALGVLLWVGLAGAVALIANMFSDKPIRVFVIESAYQLVCLIVMGAILGAWR
ncbi:MAG: DUF1761 domain-containing protein [Alphaproteobacteria bacterium]|nr:DUF1761 domain-containing protein [Alphaproteobacteria bacterium]